MISMMIRKFYQIYILPSGYAFMDNGSEEGVDGGQTSGIEDVVTGNTGSTGVVWEKLINDQMY
jgi:hypothetical protein